MEEFVKNILSRNPVFPTEQVQKAFFDQFGKKVLNLEWSRKDSDYEAIFYLRKLEYIARFRDNGELLEYRVNLPLNRIPEAQRSAAGALGEIMNVVEIHQPGQMQYELILRDQDLVRHELLLDEKGVLVSSKLL